MNNQLKHGLLCSHLSLSLNWWLFKNCLEFVHQIETQKLDWSKKSKVGSLDNAKHKPAGGDKKVRNTSRNHRMKSLQCFDFLFQCPRTDEKPTWILFYVQAIFPCFWYVCYIYDRWNANGHVFSCGTASELILQCLNCLFELNGYNELLHQHELQSHQRHE